MEVMQDIEERATKDSLYFLELAKFAPDDSDVKVRHAFFRAARRRGLDKDDPQAAQVLLERWIKKGDGWAKRIYLDILEGWALRGDRAAYEELERLAAQVDLDAYNTLIEVTEELARRMAARELRNQLDAEDVASEVIKNILALGNIGELIKNNMLLAYVKKAVRNAIYNLRNPMRSSGKPHDSLDEPRGRSPELTLGDSLKYNGPSPEEKLYETERADLIRRNLKRLSQREQTVLSLVHGLYDGEARTLEEVGRMIGVTKARVGVIKRRALAKLKPQFGPEYETGPF